VLKFLLLCSEQVQRKGGAKACPLYQFLRIFYSVGEVGVVLPSDLDPRHPVSADLLMIENPNCLTPDQLKGVRYQRVALFDYADGRKPFMSPKTKEFLSSLTDLYLKCSVERTERFPFRMGTLPLYRKKKLLRCLQIQKLKHQLWGKGERRKIDVFFAGAPTEMNYREGNKKCSYHQRTEWLTETMNPEFPYRFLGGLSYVNKKRLQEAINSNPELRPLISPRRYDFFTYFYYMCRSKIALVPGGHARWTYRHYEAIYAKSVMLSTDMRDIELMVPLPPHFVHVPDSKKILPYVEEGLRWHDESQDLLEENIRFLEQYYDRGQFSTDRPLALERFLQQLEPGYQAQTTTPRTPKQAA